MTPLIDTHTHLERFAREGSLNETLAAAKAAGVGRMVAIGTSTKDWSLYADIARERPEVEHAVGMHPCDVEDGWEAALPEIRARFAKEPRPVALGEIGLDRFHLPKEAGEAAAVMERQRAAFDAQLALAKELDVPVVVHSRGAFAECVERIDASGVLWRRILFHCFADGPGEMRQLMDRGGYGSFTGIVTYKNAESVRDAARLQGLGRLMIETDAPYLAPVPHRGKPNQPAYLAETARFCADLFGVSPEELARRTTRLAEAFYGLEPQ